MRRYSRVGWMTGSEETNSSKLEILSMRFLSVLTVMTHGDMRLAISD